MALRFLRVGFPTAGVLLAAPGPFHWSVAVALVSCAALPWCKKRPRLAVLACLPGLLGELGWAPTLVALYFLGRQSGRLKPAEPWAVLCCLASLLPVFVLHRSRWPELVLAVVASVLYSGGPAVLGMLITTREQLRASLRDLEAAREATVAAREEVARAAERDRIGREIHDSVGHHATMIAVGAAALAATTQDEQTREAANRLRLLAKTALSEMRAALGLMGTDAEASLGIAALPELVARARETGMRAELIGVDTVGDDLPLGVERTVYRLVQESLTNAAKHAEGADVKVRLERWSRELRVTVTNGPPLRDRFYAPTGRPGGGLAGLAERIGMMGGRLRARPTPKGGFSVEGRLPTPSLDRIYEEAMNISCVPDTSPLQKDTKVATGQETKDGSATERARAH
ncbi:MAG: sensor histidine kinase [Pseudonocardia sp.]|nr:sensor histidine kinase [Pseudonocardia sp.]